MRMAIALSVVLSGACATTRSSEYRGCEVEHAPHGTHYRFLYKCGMSGTLYCAEGRDALHLKCGTEDSAAAEKRNCTRMDTNKENAILVCR